MRTYWVLVDHWDRFRLGLLPAMALPMYTLAADTTRTDLGCQNPPGRHSQEYHYQAEG
jgi:hypothetical protein